MPARHLLEGAGAARVFEQQAALLRGAGWKVSAIAVAPTLSGRAIDRDALHAALERLGDTYAIVSDTRAVAMPAMLLGALAAKARGRWTLAEDRALSGYVDPSGLASLRVDAVICNYVQCISAADALAPPERQVLVLHDLDAGPIPKWLAEMAAIRGAVALLNSQEADRLFSAGVPCATLPPIYRAADAMAPDGDQQTLLFVGGAHPPNIAGLRAFITDCFAPRLAPRDVRLLIAGEAGPLALAGREAPGVECLGRVNELAEAYRAASLVICPLLEGTGSSIKIAEALAAGKPVLATPVAWRGYGIDPGAALEPPFDERWATRILELLPNRPAREELFETGASATSERTQGATLLSLVERAVRK
ncbi:MAG: glycosyltransferase family 4 protein [Terricaulis sp.]